ncbi:hypothetical protein D3C81_1617190 [compost metagenome]
MLYEAMATGLGVVAARVGGQAELVTQGCGQLIDPSSDELATAYTDELERLVGDPEQLRLMGLLARERIVQSFEQRSFEARLLLLVEQALRAPNPVARPFHRDAEQHAAKHLQWQWVTWRLLVHLGRYRGLQGRVTWRLVSASVKAFFHIRSFGLARTWARRKR